MEWFFHIFLIKIPRPEEPYYFGITAGIVRQRRPQPEQVPIRAGSTKRTSRVLVVTLVEPE